MVVVDEVVEVDLAVEVVEVVRQGGTVGDLHALDPFADGPLGSPQVWWCDPTDAAMFLFRAEIGGEKWWGHEGWWGTTAFTCPRLDVTVVAGNQQARMPKACEGLAIVGDALAAVTGP